MIGTRLGEYEVLARLGAGGMGEVYRGRDPRLKREVAIKILTGSALDDPTRRKRFEYEAQAASALNHPNILVIFDIGLHQETPYIVSELVEGETLRSLIQRGAVPLKKLLDLAVQIADGLSAAHKAGIVHRDLKPENILVNENNRVKILDFGLAKMQVPEGQAEEALTISHALSKTGFVAGTVPYMSPEQASGKNIDFRSDQFSLGLILYEMATGKRAFNRDTPAQTLSAIITEEPTPIATLNPRIPPPLRWLIDQCLTKDSHHRFDSTADLYRELRNVRDHLSETTSEEISRVAVKTTLGNKVMFAVLALLAGLAGFLIYPLLFSSAGSNFSKYHFTPLATDSAPEGAPGWSADGESLVYVKEVNGVEQVFTRSLSASIPAQITKSSSECNSPFWDPDGSRIFYTSERSLWFASLVGGSPQRMFENVVSAAISPDGKRLALLRGALEKKRELWISEPPGTEPKKITNLPGSLEYFIVFTPDGSAIACWINTTKGVSLWLVPYPSGDARMIQLPKQILEGTRFAFIPNSRYIIFGAPYWLDGHLVLVDSESGTAQPITTGYRGAEFYPAITRDGRRIAFASVENDFDLVEIPLDGSTERVLMATSYAEVSPSWGPTGKELVYSGIRDGVYGIWLIGIQEGWTRAIVTARDFDEKANATFDSPSFSPDGQRVAYQTKNKEIWVSNVAGGKPILVVPGEYGADGPSWSPDGNWIVFYSYAKALIAKVKVGGPGDPQILKEKVAYHMPRWSPKGDWISYANHNELSLISPDGKNNRVIGKGNFGTNNFWSPDGSIIYVLRITDELTWQLCSIDINSLEINLINDLGRSRTYLGLSLSPDGKSVISSKRQLESDIWMLEGFEQPRGFFSRLFRPNTN